jgi:glycosyltransferase involved in cell wall biosynthesis
MSAPVLARPAVTVIIPAYDDASDLARALELARAQTLREIEIIVVDDCSAVPVVPAVLDIAASDSRVHVIRREANGGVFAAQSTGIESATGKYIYLGSTNDPIEPDFLATATDALDRNLAAGMCFLDPGVVSGQPERRQAFSLHLADRTIFFEPDLFAERLRYRPFHLSSNTVVFRAEVLRAVGGCRSEFGLYADWFACVVSALRAGAVYVPRVLAYSRIHDDAFSHPRHWSNSVRSDYAATALRAIVAEFPEICPRLRRSLVASEFGLCVLVALREDPSVRPMVGLDALAMASLRDAWSLVRKFMPVDGRRLVRKIVMSTRKAA